MTYTILTGGSELSRWNLASESFIHLSDGAAVWVGVRDDTKKWSLWYSSDLSASAVEISADIGLTTTTFTTTEVSKSTQRALLARDDADNLYVYDAYDNKVRAYVKGPGYSWTAGAVLTPATPGDPFDSADMVWCDTGGGTNGAGHLLVVGWAGLADRTSAYRVIDAGTVLAGTGTPASTYSATGGPFGTKTVSYIASNVPRPTVNLAYDGSPGATSGAALGVAGNAGSVEVVTGSWSVNSAGTATFGYTGVVSGTYYSVWESNSALGPLRARLLNVAPDRFAAVYPAFEGGMNDPVTVTAAIVSKTAILSTGRPIPGYQITGWPYPSPAQGWDVGLDKHRSRLWVFASPDGGGLVGLGATISGTVVAWDTAVTTWDTTLPDATGLSTDEPPRVRTSRHRVTSAQDIQVSRVANGTPYGLDGTTVTFNQAPNAPALTAPADGEPVNLDAEQTFDWDFSDPDPGDSQSKYDLRYRLVGAATWTELSATTPNTYRMFAAGTFTAGEHEWQVRTYDAQGEVGPYSSSGFFTATSPPAGPSITAPTNDATISSESATLTWSTSEQDAYEVRKVADNAGAPDTATVYYTSGVVESPAARSHGLAFPDNGRAEHLQVRVRSAGLWSPWSSVRVTVNYNPPPTPTVTPGADDSAGAVVVTYSTPASAAGEPTVSYTDVYVRDTTGRDKYRAGAGIRIGTLLTPSGTFIDWLPAAGVNYEYRVIAVGDNGTTSASAWTPIDAEAAASVYYATY